MREARLAPALVGLIVGAALAAAPDAARAERLTVRGAGSFEARASRDEGELVLQGVLHDDLGEVLGQQSVLVRITRDARADDPETLAAVRAARGCGGGAATSQATGASVETDAGGRFCVRVRLQRERYTAALEWRGAGFVDAGRLTLPVDLGRRPLALSLEPRPRIVSLDRTPARFFALAESEDNGATGPGAGLPLTLALSAASPTAGSGAAVTPPLALATATTDTRGRAVLDVDAERLGQPRAASLTLAYAGDADTAPASVEVPIELHAKVTLRCPALEDRTSAAHDPEDGIALDVLATTAAGPVPEGVVEARIGDAVVGAAKLEAGRAKLVVTFAEAGTKTRELRLRYAPQSPWFEPGPELRGELALRGPSAWSRAPIAIVGLLLVAWLALGRRRPAPTRAPAPSPRAAGQHASLEIVSTSQAPKRGEYSGVVEDAHEGGPIAHARVWVERRSFEGVETLVSAVTDDDGRFAFLLESRVAGDRLAAEGPFHSRFQEELPAPGEIRVALVTRKRKLLEYLVTWARRAGSPYDARPEPTPGQVRKAAGERDVRIAAWAAAVERAAFDDRRIDERAEADVAELAPKANPAVAVPEPPPEGPPRRQNQRLDVLKPPKRV